MKHSFIVWEIVLFPSLFGRESTLHLSLSSFPTRLLTGYKKVLNALEHLFSLRLCGGCGDTVTLCASMKPCLLLAYVLIFSVMQNLSALACAILQALLPLQDSFDGTVTTICAQYWTWMAPAMVIDYPHRFRWSYSQQLWQLHIWVFRLHQQLSRHLVRWTYNTPSRSNFGYQLKLRWSSLLF